MNAKPASGTDTLPFPIPPELWARVILQLRLSPQHARLVRHMLAGMQNKEIAAAMGLAEPTLKTYLNRLFRRLGVRDRMQLAVKVFAVALSICDRSAPQGCHPDGCHPK